MPIASTASATSHVPSFGCVSTGCNVKVSVSGFVQRYVTRAIKPDAVVLARAVDPAHAQRLIGLGAVGVIPETVEASLQLAARVLEKLDLPETAVDERIEAMRQQELRRLTQGQG